MSGLSVRVSAPSAIAASHPARPAAVIEPMLPALVRGAIFLSTLAAPFIAALFLG
jgi:hypothetical protein